MADFSLWSLPRYPLTGGIVVKESAFDELLEQVIQDEADGTFPPPQKQRGLLLSGLSKAMIEMNMGEAELGESVGLSERAIRHYRQTTRGVPGIQRAARIASALGCSLRDLTTYEELDKYHNPLNSRSNRIIVSSVPPSSATYRIGNLMEKTRRLLSRFLGQRDPPRGRAPTRPLLIRREYGCV
jgi:transcriptional regulator with XRE-family HTH domain